VCVWESRNQSNDLQRGLSSLSKKCEYIDNTKLNNEVHLSVNINEEAVISDPGLASPMDATPVTIADILCNGTLRAFFTSDANQTKLARKFVGAQHRCAPTGIIIITYLISSRGCSWYFHRTEVTDYL